MKRIIGCFFVLVFWHSPVSAQDYYWTISVGPGRGTSFPSATSACQSASSIAPGHFLRLTKNGNNFNCIWFLDRAPGYTSQGVAVTNGTSCPSGTEYNHETGECVAPPKECIEGEQFPARGASAPIQISDAGAWIPSVPPSGMCYQSCSYSGVRGETSSSGCYKDPDDSTMGYCNYIIKGTGESCTTENYRIAVAGEPLNAPPTQEPPPPICPPGWALSGNTCFPRPPKPCDPSTGEVCGPETPGDGDDGDTGGGGGGGGGGDSGGGDSGGGDGGSGGDGGDSGSGDGSGSGSGGSPGTGEGDGLFEPKRGSFDGYIKDADQEITDSKKKLKEISDKYKGLIDSKLAISLSTSGGGLPCYNFTFNGSSQQVCLSTYEDEASTLRNILLLLAAIAALFIIFSRRSD